MTGQECGSFFLSETDADEEPGLDEVLEQSPWLAVWLDHGLQGKLAEVTTN